ncbi:MAG: glycosyltransferase [Pseudomonadota bacterium]
MCTYNGAPRMKKVLDFIAGQEEADELPWELLIVDNASCDDTVEVIYANWPSRLSDRIRVVHESRPGVIYARIRGCREARFDCVSFVDDDNWISSNWVAETMSVFSSHPEVALIHVKSVGHYNNPPETPFEHFNDWLAVGAKHTKAGVVETDKPVSYWTAGLSVRLKALRFLDHPEFEMTLVGRTGQTTLGGDDHELCLCIMLGGWKAYYLDSAYFTHDISEIRLRREYITKLVQNAGLSRRILNEYRSHFDPSKYPKGRRLFLQVVAVALTRHVAYFWKKSFGLLPPGVSPNEMSYRLSRGRFIGFFSTSERLPQVRKNIEIASSFSPITNSNIDNK